jgi:hypothetical protein
MLYKRSAFYPGERDYLFRESGSRRHRDQFFAGRREIVLLMEKWEMGDAKKLKDDDLVKSSRCKAPKN